LAATAVTPALAETSATKGDIPNFTRVWLHPGFPWFEPPASGPGPVTNLSRWPQRPGGDGGSVAVPPLPPGVEGVSDYDQLVGDYKNPILQPWASEVVKKFGELSLKGVVYGNPSNQCWPMPMPFIYKQFLVQIIQQPDSVQIIYTAPSTDIRRVRLNDRHPEPLTPSWYGDSVGHYEGDTLVVDTIGLNDKTFVDNFRTPHTEKLHVVERFRMIDGGKAMRVDITFDDPDAFNAPWSVTQRYDRIQHPMAEEVYAENNQQFFKIPVADKPDF
jgi:hypothetical protein